MCQDDLCGSPAIVVKAVSCGIRRQVASIHLNGKEPIVDKSFQFIAGDLGQGKPTSTRKFPAHQGKSGLRSTQAPTPSAPTPDAPAGPARNAMGRGPLPGIRRIHRVMGPKQSRRAQYAATCRHGTVFLDRVTRLAAHFRAHAQCRCVMLLLSPVLVHHISTYLACQLPGAQQLGCTYYPCLCAVLVYVSLLRAGVPNLRPYSHDIASKEICARVQPALSGFFLQARVGTAGTAHQRAARSLFGSPPFPFCIQGVHSRTFQGCDRLHSACSYGHFARTISTSRAARSLPMPVEGTAAKQSDGFAAFASL